MLTGGGLLDQNLGGLVAGATDVEAGSEVAAVHAYALQVVVNSLGVTGGFVDGDVLDAGVAALELVQGDTLQGSDGHKAYTLVVGLELVDVSLDIGVAGGDGCGLIFKKGEILRKVPEENLLDELMKEIENL